MTIVKNKKLPTTFLELKKKKRFNKRKQWH